MPDRHHGHLYYWPSRINMILRRLYYVMIVFATGIMASCQHEGPVFTVADNPVTEINAVTEEMPSTKTYMDGTSVLWSSNDRIVAFMGNTLPKRFTITENSVGSQNARFQLDESYVIEGNSTLIPANIAYYPFCEEVTCGSDGESYKLRCVELPSVQIYAPASAGNGSFPMLAVSEDTDDVNFRFRNVCGAIMFQLQGCGTVRSVSIKGNSDEVLCGEATVVASYENSPVIIMSSDGGKVVTLDCGTDGVELDSDTATPFIISLPPVPFTNGFTITVTDVQGRTQEYSTLKTNSILRSSILRMPVKEFIAESLPQEGCYIDEYGINHGQGVKIGDIVWAPVNCGYHETGFRYGKLYQWGRKYGQGYDGSLYDAQGNIIGKYYDAEIPVIEQGPVYLEVGQSSENADKYYKRNNSSYDWCADSDGGLWNLGTEEFPIKTENDPCPAGWRIPTHAELSYLSKNHSSWTVSDTGELGCWFSGSSSYASSVPQIFLPAAGDRYYRDALARGRGYLGIYWSSKPFDGNFYESYYLYFHKSVVNLNYSQDRANGCSVRCVQE